MTTIYQDATPVTPILDTYVTVVEADTYLRRRLNVHEWFIRPDADKEKAIFESTSWIDLLDYVGCKTDPAQPLEFPRGGDLEYPLGVKTACILIAKNLLEGKSAERLIAMGSMVSQGTVQSKDVYNRWYIFSHERSGIVSAEAWGYLLPYLRSINEVNLTRVS